MALGTLVPTVRPDTAYLTPLVALLGTTISPYLFFWQADQEVEEAAARGRAAHTAWKRATAGEL